MILPMFRRAHSKHVIVDVDNQMTSVRIKKQASEWVAGSSALHHPSTLRVAQFDRGLLCSRFEGFEHAEELSSSSSKKQRTQDHGRLVKDGSSYSVHVGLFPFSTRAMRTRCTH